jgi:transposase
VTYKTAYRMGMQIRKLMEANGFEMLRGHVEMDETFVGGRRTGMKGNAKGGKTVVFGLLQRGGRIETQVVPDTKTNTLRPIVLDTVEKGSTISTDESNSYNLLKRDGYNHGAVDHSRKEYAWTDHRTGTTWSTNGVEGFWKLFKDSINSTHIHISPAKMDAYLAEFSFRSNHRQMKNAMFDLLIAAI